MPENAALYDRVGGTVSHPEDFNDWGVASLFTSLEALARDYNRLTGDRIFINDVSLFFGGRFDVGRRVQSGDRTDLLPCVQGAVENCWGFSHLEHRLGTETDIQPIGRANLLNLARFATLVRRHFPKVNPEGRHWHVRDVSSVYPR